MALFGKKIHVEMLRSVAGPLGGQEVDLEAGKKYRLDTEVADALIARGYAAGGMSRERSEDELTVLRGSGHQTVSV